MPMSSRLDDFRYARWFRTGNRLLHIVLSITLVLGLNYLAARHFWRADLTRNHKYSLSPETQAYLKQIPQGPAAKPVRVVVTIPANSEKDEIRGIYNDVSRLLREYELSARLEGKRWVEVEYVDIFQQRTRAEELATLYGISQENAIVVACGERHREISGADLYEVRDGQARAFMGEQVFTSAILDVIAKGRQVIYVSTGHGELNPRDTDPLRGFSRAGQALRQRNFDVRPLDVGQVQAIPADASMVVIAGPQVPFMPVEVERLRRYLSEENGRVMVFLQPAREHGLDDLLTDWGLLSDDMLVLDSSEDFRVEGGDFLIRNFNEHPVTQFLNQSGLNVLLGLTRPVRTDPDTPPDERRRTAWLMRSGKSAWAELGYRKMEGLKYDYGIDLRGPVTVAMVSERAADSRLGIRIPGGRLLVFGNGDFLANNRFNVLGNHVLFLNAVNWALDRNAMLNIPPRQVEQFRLTLSQADLTRLGLRMLLLPTGVAVLGLLVYLVRRR